jgi:hypothetical protein
MSDREAAIKHPESLPDLRAPLPMAYSAPAFQRCLREAAATPELVAQFDRLYGATLVSRKSPLETMIDKATGKQEADLRAFAEFVHDCIYLRLPNAAIHALRLGAAACMEDGNG